MTTIVMGDPVIVDVMIPPALVVEVDIPSIPTVTVLYSNTTVIIEEPHIPVVAIPALPGPKGDKGDSGGIYIHDQVTPSASWTVVHNLNRYVSATVYVDDEIGLADSQHVDMNTLVITFPSSISGIAVIN